MASEAMEKGRQRQQFIEIIGKIPLEFAADFALLLIGTGLALLSPVRNEHLPTWQNEPRNHFLFN